ncbi:MAG: hypothetical protein M1828_005769 [Chrysothrix sp. TS-e1954]|nr:MAG: hypothetical protein M1828_005769 [Chrysothrix sp. TS-e1954]
MLFAHQAGSVKVGEVVRYTLTYTPADDRILPSPSHLHIRIKNTSAIPLRAAYLHGPYTLHVSAYPSDFNPNKKLDSAQQNGAPQFEPNLKAGGHWHAQVTVPDHIREHGDGDAEDEEGQDAENEAPKKITWIIEVASQILFSNTASVHFELLIGRDERSLDIGFAAIASMGHGEPGKVSDATQAAVEGAIPRYQTKGIYSRAIQLAVEDTAMLWNKPELPRRAAAQTQRPTSSLKRSFSRQERQDHGKQEERGPRRPKKIHLVLLTHGLHSNLGADMLYLKESIDAAAKQAREEARATRSKRRKSRETAASREPLAKDERDSPHASTEPSSTAPLSGEQEDLEDEAVAEDSEDEEVLVRGFPGNAVRTERGIQYLGKRLAKYILTFTYPDQPFLPPSKSLTRSLTGRGGSEAKSSNQRTAMPGPGEQRRSSTDLPYTFTRISFIGHSLGGLVQTYAIAYIYKHSPGFFDKIHPQNFVCLAAPLLGLSNENPMYIKFALDFGLVGRTGQDLGLTWRAPNIARTGWSAMVAGFGGNGGEEKPKQEDPRSKPLLRILPSGPAHHVLKMFRNRTVYSNVVNDGIVPLRTSCLLFLDWRGLDRVENARRENGLIGTMASFGWAELTGANTTSHRPRSGQSHDKDSDSESGVLKARRRNESPELSTSCERLSSSPAPRDDSPTPLTPEPHQFLSNRLASEPDDVPPAHDAADATNSLTSSDQASNPFGDFFNFFRASATRQQPIKPQKVSQKARRAYTRAQIVASGNDPQSDLSKTSEAESQGARPGVSRGDSLISDPKSTPPPKTSIFEAAGDILNPPLPTQSWITDPSTRSRTIFHDRVYHPEDIPPSPPKRSFLGRSFSSDGRIRTRGPSPKRQDSMTEGTGMKVEERIARAYHRDLSWRKVLVRLEPDAHNNMIVRRMFANAYGWDVVKHICDTHFSNSFASTTHDDDEPSDERAHAPDKPVSERGENVEGQTDKKPQKARTKSEMVEQSDVLVDLDKPQYATANMASGGSIGSLTGSQSSKRRQPSPRDSVDWSDYLFEGSEDDADTDEDSARSPLQTWQKFWGSAKAAHQRGRSQSEQLQPLKVSEGQQHRDTGRASVQEAGTSDAEIADFLTQSPTVVDGHRGLGLTNPPESTNEPAAQISGPPSPTSARPPSREMTALGLHTTLGDRIGSSKVSSPREDSERSASASLTKEVAKLSMDREG